MQILFDIPSERVHGEPLVPRPEDMSAFLHGLLVRGLAPGEEVRVVGAGDVESDLGWPIALFHVNVVRRDEVVAARLLALYSFFEWVGVATADGVDEDCVAAVTSGRPDVRGRHARCLADILGPAVAS